jgi:hypothetical protein
MPVSESESVGANVLLQWGARLVVAAGVLLTAGFLVAWLAPDQHSTIVALALVAGPLLLTLPLLIALPPYLLHRWEQAAWFPSLACGVLLILIAIGFVTVLRPDRPLPQVSWYSWETLIVSLKLFGALLTAVAIISFWNRPQGVAAATLLTGVIAYHLAGVLDGYYPEAWRLVVALVFAGSWVWLGFSVAGMGPE